MRDMLLIMLFFIVALGTFEYIESRKDPYEEGMHLDYTIICDGSFKYKAMGGHRGTILLLNSDGTPLKCNQKRY